MIAACLVGRCKFYFLGLFSSKYHQHTSWIHQRAPFGIFSEFTEKLYVKKVSEWNCNILNFIFNYFIFISTYAGDEINGFLISCFARLNDNFSLEKVFNTIDIEGQCFYFLIWNRNEENHTKIEDVWSDLLNPIYVIKWAFWLIFKRTLNFFIT